MRPEKRRRHALLALLAAVVAMPFNGWAQYRPGVNNHVTLLGRLNEYSGYSNIWGYTDAQGREYALLGASTGLSIIEITDPRQPVERAYVPGPFSGWREIKTHLHYAYVVSEGTSPQEYTGVQIINLSKLPDSVSFHSYRWPGVDAGSARAHTVSIDDAGYLYVQGGTATRNTAGQQGGVRVFNLADPEAPAPMSFYNARYVHDSFIRGNILFDSNINDGGWVDVLDISDRAAPRLLTSIIYPRGFSHNSGTTEDGNYLITTDEVNGYTVKFWDIRVLWDNDPSNDGDIELVAEYLSNPGEIAHNVHVRGAHAYISHYNEGVRVLDISNPRDPAEVGYYVTPSDWGVYPYFPSHHLVLSDIPSGLYVVRFDSVAAATVQGAITNAETGAPIAGATILFVEADRRLAGQADGSYRLRTSAGTHTVVIQAFPFKTDTTTITLSAGGTLTLQHALEPLLHASAITGTVRDAQGNGLPAKLTLFASSTVVPPYTIVANSDAQGRFAFENIYSTSPPLLSYDRLLVEPEIPYAAETLLNIAVSPDAPTVLDLTAEPAEVLLVDDDPGGNYENFYRETIEQLGLTAYYWKQQQRGLAPVSLLPRFKRQSLIWYTGDAAGSNVLSAAERDSLAALLDRGGRLFLTGQNIAESLRGSDFLRTRLHADFVRNISADFILHGVRGDAVGGGWRNLANAGAGGANNQISRDELQPLGLALPCVVFDTTAGTVAAVHVAESANESRLVFFGFGFEAIIARAGFSSRADVLRDVLNWLEGTTAVEAPPHAGGNLPLQFALSASHPNPLRLEAAGAAAIHYQLPAGRPGEKVSLKIYDLLGREVRSLIDETHRPGAFTARWDGRDQRGELVKSGIYFYRLTAGALHRVRKLIVVR